MDRSRPNSPHPKNANISTCFFFVFCFFSLKSLKWKQITPKILFNINFYGKKLKPQNPKN